MMKQDMLLCTKKLRSWRGLLAQDLRRLLALLREADVCKTVCIQQLHPKVETANA